MAKLIRVNTRIGQHHSDWLNEESERTGMSKSSIIQLAIDNYMRQNQSMSTLEQMILKIENLENKIEEHS